MFWHPCKICGLVNAANGFNVSLKNNRPGDWFCAEHIPEQYRKTASTAGDLCATLILSE